MYRNIVFGHGNVLITPMVTETGIGDLYLQEGKGT